MRSFRHGVSIRFASITRESSGHGVVRFEGIELPVDEGKRRGNGYPDNDYDHRGSIEQIFFNHYSSRSVDDFSLPSSSPPQIFRNKEGDNVGTGGAKDRRDLVAELSRRKLGIGGQRSEGDVVSRAKGQSLSEGGETMEEKERGRRFTVLVGPAEMQPHLLHP